MRTILIVVRDTNGFDVHDGASFADQLTWGEMLGLVARVTHPVLADAGRQIPPYRMDTIDQLREQLSAQRRRISELEEQLAPPRPRKTIDELVTNI